MKIIFVCGEHANETGTMRVCHDLRRKRNSWMDKVREYSNLSELAGRRITDKEVVFVNIAGKGLHRLVRDINKLSLQEIIKMYETHIKENKEKIPSDGLNFLSAYIRLWKERIDLWKSLWERSDKNWESTDIEYLEGIIHGYTNGKSKFINKIEELCNRFTTQVLDKQKDADITKIRKIMFPSELHKFVFPDSLPIDTRYLGINDSLDIHTLNVDKEIADTGITIILSLHSTPMPCDRGVPNPRLVLLAYPKSFDSGARKDFLKLILDYSEDRMMSSPYESKKQHVGTIVLELWYPYIEKSTSKIYREIPTYPKIYFLNRLSKATRHDTSLISLSSKVVKWRYGFTDPKLYGTDEFKRFEENIACIIREVLEWGEKWEAMAGK